VGCIRLSSCLVALGLFLGPSGAAAQTTTRDGVQALLRGDYQTAARILRPLAEDSAQPDPTAQFFLATMYDSGHGMAPSSFRACGMYLAAATPQNPFMRQSLGLARAFREQSSPAIAQLCTPIGTDDYGHLPSASFDLAADHKIILDASGATVTYRGTQARTHWEMKGSGHVFLLARHIQLVVSRPLPTTRHFIQLFIWRRESSDPPVWSLGWILNEVIGSDVLPVTGDPSLLTLAVPDPPSSFETESVAGVRLNPSGEAEWFISTGSHPRSAVVPFKEPR
jgi:hypothetical protein